MGQSGRTGPDDRGHDRISGPAGSKPPHGVGGRAREALARLPPRRRANCHAAVDGGSIRFREPSSSISPHCQGWAPSFAGRSLERTPSSSGPSSETVRRFSINRRKEVWSWRRRTASSNPTKCSSLADRGSVDSAKKDHATTRHSWNRARSPALPAFLFRRSNSRQTRSRVESDR